MYRLISLIGPHCPESTYSSTYPFSGAHFVVATKKIRNKKNEKKELKKGKQSSKPVKGEEKKRKDKHARMPIYRTLTCSISLKQKNI